MTLAVFLVVCDGPKEEVIRLQTTTPLFRAYEHAYNLLENTFLPLFHQSDDVSSISSMESVVEFRLIKQMKQWLIQDFLQGCALHQ